MGVSRFDVFLANLDPTLGSELGKSHPRMSGIRMARLRDDGLRKARPCVVVSPDEMNRRVRTVVVAPMTTAGRRYPSRVPVRFAGKDGQVVIDQLRTVDKARLGRRLGALEAREAAAVLDVLREFFAP